MLLLHHHLPVTASFQLVGTGPGPPGARDLGGLRRTGLGAGSSERILIGQEKDSD